MGEPDVSAHGWRVGARFVDGLAGLFVTWVVVTGLIVFAPDGGAGGLEDIVHDSEGVVDAWWVGEGSMATWGRQLMRLFQGDFGVSSGLHPGVPVSHLVGEPMLWTAARAAASAALLCLMVPPLAISGLGRHLTTRAVLLLAVPVVLLALGAGSTGALPFALGPEAWGAPRWYAPPVRVQWPAELALVALVPVASGALVAMLQALEARRKELVAQQGPSLGGLARGLVGPFLVVLGDEFPRLVVGAMAAECLVLMPGVGTLFVDAAFAKDQQLAAGLAFLAVGLAMVVRMAAEGLYVGMELFGTPPAAAAAAAAPVSPAMERRLASTTHDDAMAERQVRELPARPMRAQRSQRRTRGPREPV